MLETPVLLQPFGSILIERHLSFTKCPDSMMNEYVCVYSVLDAYIDMLYSQQLSHFMLYYVISLQCL